MEKDGKTNTGFKKGNIDAALLNFIKDKNKLDEQVMNEMIREVPDVTVKEKFNESIKEVTEKVVKKKGKNKSATNSDQAAIIIKESNYKSLKFKSISESVPMKGIISEIFIESKKLKLDFQELKDYIISKRPEKGRLISIDKELNKEILLKALKLDVSGNGYLNYILSINLK